MELYMCTFENIYLFFFLFSRGNLQRKGFLTCFIESGLRVETDSCAMGGTNFQTWPTPLFYV